MIRPSYTDLQFSEIGDLSMHQKEIKTSLFEESEERGHDHSKGTGIWSFCYHVLCTCTFQVAPISGCTAAENCIQLKRCTDG